MKNIFATFLLTVAIVCNSTPVLALEHPWPMDRHDARHSAVSPNKGPQFGKVEWRFSTATSQSATSSPVIALDGTIYFGSADGYLYALRENKTTKWKFPTVSRSADGRILPPAAAVGADGSVYVGPDYLHVLDPATGKEKMKSSEIFWVGTAPTVGTDGTIYFGQRNSFANSGPGNVWAFSPAATVKWPSPFNTQQGVYNSPAIGPDGTVYVGDSAAAISAFLGKPVKLYAIKNGVLRKSFQTTEFFWEAHSAVSSSGTVYFSLSNPAKQEFHSFGPALTKRWSKRNISGVPAIAKDGTIYIGSGNTLFAFTPTGAKKWSRALPADVSSPVVIDSNGFLYLGAGKVFYCVRPNDGSIRWKCTNQDAFTSSSAIGANKIIYVGTENGRLCAIR